VQYHSHDCNYTILGLNKKQFSKSKTKKRTKSFFCIINDIQACSQNKTKRLLETGDINCAFTAIVSQHATQSSAGLNPRIEQTPGHMQKQPQHLQNSQMNTLERRQNTLELSHTHEHTHEHTNTHHSPQEVSVSNCEDDETILGHDGAVLDIDVFIEKMQNKIRLGDCQARLKMQRILLLYAYQHSYKRIFNTIKINEDNGRAEFFINIDSMPEITLLLHQCMLPTKQYEDDLIILIRSCIPFFQNPRRVKHDHAWQEENDNSLIILLKWCMPSILSLYPHIFVKDVNYKARVALFRLFRELFVGPFEARNSFYVNNKTLVKMCLMEYIYYHIQYVNPLPNTTYIKTLNISTMATNILNIGQQFRVELNLEFIKILHPISTANVGEILLGLQAKCHIMFERCCRYNKNSMSHNYQEVYQNNTTILRPIRNKQDLHSVLSVCMPLLGKIPYTQYFSVFDMHCRRHGIDVAYINVLWETMKTVKVYEISANLIQAQKQILARKCKNNSVHIQRLSTILVCLFCTQKNVCPTFRHDVRMDEYTCNRCNIKNSVFEIDLIGRVVVLCGMPLIFSICCNEVVVLSGTGTEFTPLPFQRGQSGEQEKCRCVKWDRNATSVNFQHVLESVSLSQSISLYTQKAPVKWDTASREYMQQRIAGSTQNIVITQSTRNMCCMCKINAVQQKYILLDVYNARLVIVPVCSKHGMPMRVMPTITTVTAYIQFILFKERK